MPSLEIKVFTVDPRKQTGPSIVLYQFDKPVIFQTWGDEIEMSMSSRGGVIYFDSELTWVVQTGEKTRPDKESGKANYSSPYDIEEGANLTVRPSTRNLIPAYIKNNRVIHFKVNFQI